MSENKLVEIKSTMPSHVVCVGASAGGLEAIESLFSNMPSDSGMAFVVIQHLSPDYKSLMVELLSKKTNMEVLRAEDSLLIESNKIYLIPPKKNLKTFHGKLILQDQSLTKGINLPIDIFMKSLAEDIGEKAIGIVLSGTGSDGTRGIRAIKESGGMIMVQDEETAKFDGMPRSAISTGLADYVLAPEDMPSQLIAYGQNLKIAKKSNLNELLTDEENLNRIFSKIREIHKIDFSFYKKSTILRRLERRMTINHQNNIKDYVSFIDANEREITTLYQEFLIGVTSFFRDEEAFNMLKEKWIPDLIKKHRNDEMRFWVVGCSTGEEAYSLAILCKETMEQLNIQVDIKIFATDIDNKAIIKAGSGIYPFNIAADINQYLLKKYFIPKGENFQIVRSIREMVVFAQHNITRDPPFTNIQLVSCRNLLIYLQPVMQQKVLNMLNFSLNQGGILFLGSSESTGELLDMFESLNTKWKIFRSRGRNKLTQGMRNQNYKHLPSAYERYNNTNSSRYHQFQNDLKLFERIIESFQDEYLPVSILVNEQNEIIRIIGDASRYIRIPVGRMLNDITKMAVEELLIPIATGLQKVFKHGENVNYTNIRFKGEDTNERINLRLRKVKEKKGQLHYALIYIEQQKLNAEDGDDTLVYDLDKDAQQRISDLEQELQYTRESLQASIEELETSNEELQATNEELLASNEELQSTNEELQSVNEELHTVNAEYQSKILELAELNNDMDNLMQMTEMGILFLDENLNIRKFTPMINQILDIGFKNIGEHIMNVKPGIINFDLFKCIEILQQKYKPVIKQVQNRNKDWFLLKVLPYKLAPGVFSGVVISVININVLKDTEATLEKREEWLKTAAKLMRAGYWEIDNKTGKTLWSDGIYDIHEVDKDYDNNVENGISFYHPEDQPKLTSAIDAAVKEGTPFDLELRFTSAKGKKLWVRTLGQAEKQDNRVERVFGAFQDITKFKKMQLELEKSK